jgi:hypothetical protein
MNRYAPPDILAQVSFYGPGEGGLKRFPTGGELGCCLCFKDDGFDPKGENFDGFLWLESDMAQQPQGMVVVVPITFLRAELVKDRLSVGTTFRVWRGGWLGEGVIVNVS